MTMRGNDSLMKRIREGRPARQGTRLLLALAVLGLGALLWGCGEKSRGASGAGRGGDMGSSTKTANGREASRAALMEAKGSRPPRTARRAAGGDLFVKKMLALIDRACACKDRGCAMKTLGELSALKTTYAHVRLRRGQNAMLQKRSLRFGRCLGRRGVKPAEIMQALK
jgi:hypothetical protein